MHTYEEIVRMRLRAAATAAGVADDTPGDGGELLVSAAIRQARRCGVSISGILDDPLSLDGDL